MKMASQVSLPSTPQQNTSYDTYMQSLQQKLSSISMQNASTLLHVDSSAPTSGTATTEMLSPVQEFDAGSSTPSTNETPKHNYKNLNHELTKINSRKESAITNPLDIAEQSIELQASAAITELPNQSENFDAVAPPPSLLSTVEKPDAKPDAKPLEKIRRVSRFKMALKQVPSLQDIPSSVDNHLICSARTSNENPENHVEIRDSVTFINNTMLQLQENVQTSYLSQAKSIIAAVPSGWTTEHNETFEDMLARQQAELNALIEAHRKQQIEYMKSITDVSKSSSNSNTNRKDS